MPEVLRSHNLFLNTTDAQSGPSSRDASFRFPQGVMAAGNDEMLRVSLTSFSMKDSGFYGVDNNSNRFFLLRKNAAGVVTSYPVVVPVGSYHLFSDLCDAIRLAINAAAIADNITVVILYDGVTQRASYTFNGLNLGDEIKIVCFTLSDTDHAIPEFFETVLSDNNLQSERFSTAFEILGGANQRNLSVIDAESSGECFDRMTSCVKTTAAPTTYISLAPLRFSYLENIYIRTDFPNNNWEGAGFSTGGPREPTCHPSNILAKVHIGNPYNDDYSTTTATVGATPITTAGTHRANRGRMNIYWRDTGSQIWSQTLPITSINNLRIRITDEYNRIIPFPSPEAEDARVLGAEIALRVDVLGY